MTDRDEALVTCPLCGTRFPGKESCPSGCPLAGGCKTLCCPNCDYRFVLDSTLVRWVQRLVGRKSA